MRQPRFCDERTQLLDAHGLNVVVIAIVIWCRCGVCIAVWLPLLCLGLTCTRPQLLRSSLLQSKADEANAAAATSAPDSAAKGASSTLPSLKEAIAHAATFWTLSKADNDLIDPSTGRCSLSTRAWQFLFQDVHSVAIGPSFNDLYADIQATLAAATLVNRVVRLLVYKQEQSKK